MKTIQIHVPRSCLETYTQILNRRLDKEKLILFLQCLPAMRQPVKKNLLLECVEEFSTVNTMYNCTEQQLTYCNYRGNNDIDNDNA